MNRLYPIIITTTALAACQEIHLNLHLHLGHLGDVFVQSDLHWPVYHCCGPKDRATAVMLGMQDCPLSRIMCKFLDVDKGDTATSSTGPREGSLSLDEGFSFTKVEFEAMHSCPSRDVCQTFRDAHRNMGEKDGGEEEQLGVISITVVGESMQCDWRA